MNQIPNINVFSSQLLENILYDHNFNNNYDNLYDIIIEKILEKKRTLPFTQRIIYPYFNHTKELLKLLSPKFISNISIFMCLFAYFTHLERIFLLFSPLIIINFVIITLVQLFEWDTLIIDVFGNKNFNKMNRKFRKKLVKKDEEFYIFSHIVSFLYHFIPALLIILFFNYQDKNNIMIINFMENSFILLFITLLFWLLSDRPYGKIKEEIYILIYICLIFVINYMLFNNN